MIIKKIIDSKTKKTKTKYITQLQVINSFSGEITRKSKTHRNKKDALKWERDIQVKNDETRERIYQGGLFIDRVYEVHNANMPTLAPTTKKTYKSLIKNHIVPCYGHLRPVDINKELVNKNCENLINGVAQYIDKNGNFYHPSRLHESSVNIIIKLLKIVTKELYFRDLLVSDPLKSIRPFKFENERIKPMSDDEVSSFLKGLYSYDIKFRDIFIFALYTAMRKGEICGLNWGNVDLGAKTIIVGSVRDSSGFRKSTKGKKNRTLFMADPVFEILSRLKIRANNPKKTDLVFTEFVNETLVPVSYDGVYDNFKASLKKIGIDDTYVFHDLRHTYATKFIRSGGDIYKLQKILGHSKLALTEAYLAVCSKFTEDVKDLVQF